MNTTEMIWPGSLKRVVRRRRTDMQMLKARLGVTVETLQQIAALPRGGLAKRLASATLHFITPEAPKPYPKATCPVCGKQVCLYKHGFRSHRHKGSWCVGTHRQPPNIVLGDTPAQTKPENEMDKGT